MITPKILKGFRDFLPSEEAKRQWCLKQLAESFGAYGFLPIDTPVLEYAEVLLGKGGGETDKQVYHFQDNGGREVAMRFDLTVPLARYVSQHFHELTFPFKRFHMAKVWRGENPQKGRYREFVQCDFDTLGADPLLSDIDTLLLVVEALTKLKAPAFKVSFSHRSLMKELLVKLNLSEKEVMVLRTIDKLAKIGEEKVRELLAEEGLAGDSINSLMNFVGFRSTKASEVLAWLGETYGDFSCLEHLAELVKVLEEVGKADYFILDLSIMRGLDYYTGLIFETTLNDHPSLGSVCSGGRYDNLISLYSKNSVSGIGGSVGLDRLLAALEGSEEALVDGMIAFLDSADTGVYFATAGKLREAGLKIEVYENHKKIGQQFDFAQNKGARVLIFAGRVEVEKGLISWKDLATKESFNEKPFADLVAYLAK